ncbi:MAG: 4-(cytidine 5'-diphospho)-2-C-methyl-D-erythritol kinase [Lunatimonas sp.]|uniref:4-(cytidine 5'-diphospho)-2-C-methyl-D-erythritol kinase n=1 Tax=Lunatimonas sp. TaxID=2060141 RepID=UPI00263A78C4|nr:4-(cytidine 5'-diphospho)-2-C-methyl-D-erythritol kinase [Lunatimonas sp.]MCC5938284.1 4-(cytidine 5'-diphospho)-2-C-methyl-D-erythritol kinase [Lunatimonas sp.]
MIVFPNAKINLGLYITSKRSDGFHEIQSCMYPIPLCDALEIQIAKKTRFESSGIPIPGNPEDNLILKAYRLLKKDFPDLPPISVHLHKHIPIGAGLGGGSADAAFALKSMNTLFELYLEDWILEDYAAQLGSDCPFFITNRPKLVSGRGELMQNSNLDLSGKWILLIYPSIHIGTKEAYSGVTPKPMSSSLKECLDNPREWKSCLQNDFEESIFPNHPEIHFLKNQLYGLGAYYAAMSGSGSSVFGLFEEEPPKVDAESSHFSFRSQL